jgi:DNA end-binding protein Ku
MQMARAIWTGAVSFGLVNVPVGLYSATQEHEVRFHQFEKGTSARIRNRRVNEETGDEVEYDDIVKGAEVSDGKYVQLTQEELESVEPGRSRTIDISDFVEAAEIDPIYYQKSYYLAPSGEEAAKAYHLLARAMDKAGRIGIASFVMRSKEYLAAIRPQDGVLVLETMYFADEVRDPVKEIDQLPAKARVGKKDVDMAVRLIEAMSAKWNPKNYRDTYTDRVEQLVEAKKNNEEIVEEAGEAESSEKVTSLLEALQASLDGGKKHRAGTKDRGGKLRTQPAGPEFMSKQELDAVAKELEVEGRSKMSKKELIKAVEKAQKAAEKASSKTSSKTSSKSRGKSRRKAS